MLCSINGCFNQHHHERRFAMLKNDPISQRSFSKRVRRHVTGRIREYYAVTSPGLERFCRRELSELGLCREKPEKETGGVTFYGRFVDCMKVNLHLRTATRVLMRISSFSATNTRKLEKKAADIPWELFLPSGTVPEVKVRSIKSRLYHTDAITDGLLNGITRRMSELSIDGSPSFPQTLFARVVNDHFTLSLDSSGEPLYKRGLKPISSSAPIRETLAAAILKVAGYDPQNPLVDPFCGSGTFSLEAAMVAKQMAPGLLRSFSFVDWPAFRENQWAFLKKKAESKKSSLNRPVIFASDIKPKACNRLLSVIANKHLSDAVKVQQKDFFHCHAGLYDGTSGLVVINPPYGKRLGSSMQAKALFKDICRHLTLRFKGWSVALITPSPGLARRLPFPAKQMPLLHGGLQLVLIIGKIK